MDLKETNFTWYLVFISNEACKVNFPIIQFLVLIIIHFEFFLSFLFDMIAKVLMLNLFSFLYAYHLIFHRNSIQVYVNQHLIHFGNRLFNFCLLCFLIEFEFSLIRLNLIYFLFYCIPVDYLN